MIKIDKNVKIGSKLSNKIIEYSNIDSEIKTYESKRKELKSYLLDGMIKNNIEKLKLNTGKSTLSITKCERKDVSYNKDKINKYFNEKAKKHVYKETIEINPVKIEMLIEEGKIPQNIVDMITTKTEVFSEEGIEEAYDLGLVDLATVKKCTNITVNPYIKLGRKLHEDK